MPAESVVDLIAELGHGSKQVRLISAARLGALLVADASQAAVVVSALESGDPRCRWGAAFALAQAGLGSGAVVEAALEALGSEDGDVRWAAASLLRRLDSPLLVLRLRALAAADNAQQRKMALYGLRDLGERDTTVFVAALDDEVSAVRQAALAGIARVPAEAVDAAVLGRVVTVARQDVEGGVRRAALATLGALMMRGGGGEAGRREVDAALRDIARATGDGRDARAALLVLTRIEEAGRSARARPAALPTTEVPMSELADRACKPCREGTPQLDPERRAELLGRLTDWRVLDEKRLAKSYTFADFRSALAFVNRVGEVAETEGHHPEFSLGWGHASLEIWTHAAGGLTENDFILAAKADRVYAASSSSAVSPG